MTTKEKGLGAASTEAKKMWTIGLNMDRLTAVIKRLGRRP
jgi:hypothetical protein